MDLKKLFKNNEAVSPVIGVILMVAITVILAAAIGSSVFGQGTAKPAPQANFDIKSGGINTTDVASVKIEHLGGDPISFGDNNAINVVASLNGGESKTIYAVGLKTVSVGDVKTLALTSDGTANVFSPDLPKSGQSLNIKIIDVQTKQLISAKDIRL
jgi:flagellin-like protein